MEKNMDREGLKSFFDLGNSLNQYDADVIGEKGHGTKIYFNSRKIDVITIKNEMRYHAVMKEPKRELFNQHMVDAPKWYCKKIVKIGSLKNLPEIKYQAVFYVRGTKVKYEYNPMIRRSGYTAPEGSYTIQDRCGVRHYKNFIPIKRVNKWIASKGAEHTKLHAFINCQGLRLTANRGLFENTPSEVQQDLREAANQRRTSKVISRENKNDYTR